MCDRCKKLEDENLKMARAILNYNRNSKELEQELARLHAANERACKRLYQERTERPQEKRAMIEELEEIELDGNWDFLKSIH